MEIQELKNAITSINAGFCTKDEFKNSDVFECNGNYYSQDNYVILHNGEICETDEATFCECNEEFYNSYDTQRVFVGRNEEIWSEDAISNNDFTYFDGNYYDDDALERNEIVYLEDTQEYSYLDNAYWSERNEEYRSEPDSSQYTRSYHNGTYKNVSFDNISEYKIGFEIEKEDEEVLESIEIEDFEAETDNVWRKEKDGSLSDSSGFELISPTFEFDIDKIFELIESNDILLNHINADFGHNCGGHINLSKNGLSGNEFFDLVKGYTPLFYSLYYGRVDKTFSKGKSNADLKNENQKYQAIKIHDNRIEFRIISAVPNVKTLKWRSRLLEMICQNPTDCVAKAYFNIDTIFQPLLAEMYPTSEKMETLKNRIKMNTLKFENITL